MLQLSFVTSRQVFWNWCSCSRGNMQWGDCGKQPISGPGPCELRVISFLSVTNDWASHTSGIDDRDKLQFHPSKTKIGGEWINLRGTVQMNLHCSGGHKHTCSGHSQFELDCSWSFGKKGPHRLRKQAYRYGERFFPCCRTHHLAEFQLQNPHHCDSNNICVQRGTGDCFVVPGVSDMAKK